MTNFHLPKSTLFMLVSALMGLDRMQAAYTHAIENGYRFYSPELGRWLNRDSVARRYLTDAIFPYYIVHQTAIIAIAHALRGSGIPAGIEAGLIIGGTAGICVVTFEIVRRVGWLRPLFGLKAGAAGSAMPVQASGQAAN